MTINRRKFISTSSLGFLGLSLFNNIPFNFLSSSQRAHLNQTIPQLLQQAALKRRTGLLIEAENLYNQVIILDSSEVRAYDGLRKILLQSKYNELEVLQLYNNGLVQNPNSIVFRERIAKEFMRLALGNAKFSSQLNIDKDLLELSKSIFSELKEIEGVNNQIVVQYEKVERKIQQNANSIDARFNIELKDYKKENRVNFKKRFSGVDFVVLESKLNTLVQKPITPERRKHVKELYLFLAKEYSKNNNVNNSIQKLNELYNYDSHDVNSLRMARKICKKHSGLDALENFERQNDMIKNTYWSKIALIDVLLRKYRRNGSANPYEIESLINTAFSLKYRPNHYFEIYSRKFKFSIIKGDESIAKHEFLKFVDSISGISSAHYIDRFNLLCVRYFKKFGNDKLALETISIALKEIEKVPENDLLKKIFKVNEGKNKNAKPIHNERLNNIRKKLMDNQLD